ncbi:MAG: peptidoglycan DD-metalloendopeptidase family protein [Phormidesmis sp. CAN_BIN44]|nr:peptidoglycan DD-metalloendopeptidase family protein [Phormidesmis sp. CAN_BIN44]
MKRAFPQQESIPVPFSGISDDAVTEQLKQTLPEANRRVRTSAAMIGLAAISMGAYSLLAPQQGDAAAAAEPIATEPTPTVSNPSEVAVIQSAPKVASAATVPSIVQTVEHTVQEGQTLWKIAKFYQVDTQRLAAANHLRSSAVLHVGQVLQVPVDGQTAQLPMIQEVGQLALDDGATSPTAPVSIIASSQSGTYASPAEARQLLKSRQDVAVANLKQERDRLKLSLAELKSEESKNASKSVQANVHKPLGREAASLVSYQVSPGDTLTAIAQTHGTSSSELANINQLTNPNLLEVNQFIKVPQSQAVSPLSSDAAPIQVPSSMPSELTQVASGPLPTVPSLATVNSSDPVVLPSTEVAIPVGIGGDASQISLNPARSRGQSYTGIQTPENVRQDDGQYVSSLVTEIIKLREKYQSKSVSVRARPQSSSRAQALVPASLSPIGNRRVNPEFKPSRNLESLQAELRSLQSDRKAAFGSQTKTNSLVADAPKPKTQTVAMAPAGSETYAPLVRSSVGKMVSPSLPPIGKPDAYLPGSSGQFNGYIWPAKGMLTSGYGWRWGRMHKGVDIAAPVGTPVVAAAPGKIITAGWNDGGYGNLVEVKHADGSVTLYGHNSRILVKVGQTVAQGQQIADMGSTGFSTGPHSHFEVHLPGRGAVNPVAHLPQFRG